MLYIITAEGRLTPPIVGTGYSYDYYLTDHLGNTRVTFNQNGKILQTDSYYPFDMSIERLSSTNNALENKYKYNGKEFQDDFNLDWYAYGFRMYDPQIGRFPSLDPKAEEFAYLSPYNYASNNPSTNIDLWGLQGISPRMINHFEAKAVGNAIDKGVVVEASVSLKFTKGKLAAKSIVGGSKKGGAVKLTSADMDKHSVGINSQEGFLYKNTSTIEEKTGISYGNGFGFSADLLTNSTGEVVGKEVTANLKIANITTKMIDGDDGSVDVTHSASSQFGYEIAVGYGVEVRAEAKVTLPTYTVPSQKPQMSIDEKNILEIEVYSIEWCIGSEYNWSANDIIKIKNIDLIKYTIRDKIIIDSIKIELSNLTKCGNEFNSINCRLCCILRYSDKTTDIISFSSPKLIKYKYIINQPNEKLLDLILRNHPARNPYECYFN